MYPDFLPVAIGQEISELFLIPGKTSIEQGRTVSNVEYGTDKPAVFTLVFQAISG